MCELKAFMLIDGGDKLIMEDVAIIKPEDDEIVLTDILGQQKRVRGKISEVRVMEHKVYLTE